MGYLPAAQPSIQCVARQVVKTVWILSCCVGLVVGGYSGQIGPAYRLTNRQCTSDSGCSSETGEVCWWLYDGCQLGHCMCDPRTQVMGGNGQCQQLVVGGEPCTSRDVCGIGMHCVEGLCACATGRMSQDKMFCHSTHNKLLGEECDEGRDQCWQRASFGYTKRDVLCSHKHDCRCAEGYKQDGVTCRRWRIGETGCGESYHCEGGALCISSVCRCPTGYHSVAGNTKCAKSGATYNLPVGGVCDELHEKRYCGYGLLCHECSSYSTYTCVRLQLTNERSGVSPAPHNSLASVLLVTVLLRTLYVLITSSMTSQRCSNADPNS